MKPLRIFRWRAPVALMLLTGIAHASDPPPPAAADDRQHLLELMVNSVPPAEAVVRAARDAFARAEQSGDVSLQAIARGVECQGQERLADEAAAKQACAEMARLAVEADDLAVFVAERMNGVRLLERGHPLDALPNIVGSYAAAVRSGNTLATAAALLTLGSAAQFAGANADAVDYYARASSLAERIGADGLSYKIANNLGVLLLETGDPTGARTQFEAAIEAARRLPPGRSSTAALYGLVLTEMETGDARAAVVKLRSLIDQYGSQENPIQRGEAQLQLARAELDVKRLAPAETAARAAIALLGSRRPVRAYPAQALLVEILVAGRRLDEAERLIDSLMPTIPEDARGRVELLEAREHALLARGRYADAYSAAVEARRVRAQQSVARSSRTLAFMRARALAEERSRELMDLRREQARAVSEARQARVVRNLTLALFAVTLLGGVALVYLARARRRLETEVARRRSINALGNLTGGVAHDFNNLMTIVRQSMALLRRNASVASNGSALSLIDEADSAAVLGGQIATELLTFARQQPGRPEVLNLQAFFAERRGLFERALGSLMTLRVEPIAGEIHVRTDPAQLATSMINLLTNARDAMDARGEVLIRVEGVPDSVRVRRWPHLTPRRYVAVAVVDQGIGMTSEVMGEATTPFFTTKDLDRGTGLGLSTVDGFVTQAGGVLQIDSEPGVGSTVALVLPVAESGAKSAHSAST